MPKHTAPPERYASSASRRGGAESRSRKEARHVPVSSPPPAATEKSRSDGYARASASASARASRTATDKGDSPGSKKRKSFGAWEGDETERLREAIQSHAPPYDWHAIADHVQTRSPEQCKSKNQKMMLKDGPTSASTGGMAESVGNGGAAANADCKQPTPTRRPQIAKAKSKSNAKASASSASSSASSVPHKARRTRGKKAKPTTTAADPVAKSASVLQKDRAGGQRRASNSKKGAATKKKEKKKTNRTEITIGKTSIGRTPTSTRRRTAGPTVDRTTAVTQPKKEQEQEQSPISDRKVSTTQRTKEGRALKRKAIASPEGSTGIPIDGIAQADGSAPSASDSDSAASTPKGSTKTSPKKVATKKRRYVVKKNPGGHGAGPGPGPTKAASGKWTDEESQLFDEAVELYGRGDWCVISNHVGSRTPTQCKSHNQKVAIKEEKERARNKSNKQESKKEEVVKKKKTTPPPAPAQVSAATTPSRTVSPSPSPTSAHADAAAVLFSMRG